MRRHVACFQVGLIAVLAACGVLLVPSAAEAHSRSSSTIAVQVLDDGVSATISIATTAMAEALETSAGDLEAEQVVEYLDEHMSATGADGTDWEETYSDPVRETVEGIDSLRIDVELVSDGVGAAGFMLRYDAVIADVDGHEAVVVLTDVDGEISTAGVLDASTRFLAVGVVDASLLSGVGDMVGYGFDHVLEHADHVLFLVALLLPAPLIAAGGRWSRRSDTLATIRKVLVVVTAFTVGHSLTLIAASLGWVSLPERPVEVLVAVSVGVAALHALRPLAPNGEAIIAGVFGLFHGLAFASILVNLGLSGSGSVTSLLAFNVGVELAQVMAAALILPPLLLMATTRFYPAVRIVGGSIALVAALGWTVDRLGFTDNPFAGVEEATIGHPWSAIIALTVVAVTLWLLDRRLRSNEEPQKSRSEGSSMPRNAS